MYLFLGKQKRGGRARDGQTFRKEIPKSGARKEEIGRNTKAGGSTWANVADRCGDILVTKTRGDWCRTNVL